MSSSSRCYFRNPRSAMPGRAIWQSSQSQTELKGKLLSKLLNKKGMYPVWRRQTPVWFSVRSDGVAVPDRLQQPLLVYIVSSCWHGSQWTRSWTGWQVALWQWYQDLDVNEFSFVKSCILSLSGPGRELKSNPINITDLQILDIYWIVWSQSMQSPITVIPPHG